MSEDCGGILPERATGAFNERCPPSPAPAATATQRNFFAFLAGLFICRDAAEEARKEPFEIVSTSGKNDDEVRSEYGRPGPLWVRDNFLLTGIHLGKEELPPLNEWVELRKEMQGNGDGETLPHLDGVYVVLRKMDDVLVAAFYDSGREEVWLAPIGFLPHPSYPAMARTS